MEAFAPWAEPVLMSAEELLQLPEDGWCYELVEGRLVRMSPTGARHGDVVTTVILAVGQFVREHKLGTVFSPETGFWISSVGEPDTVLAPDLAFVRRERESAAKVEGYPRMAPDLIIEVASPSQGRPMLAAKAQRWLSAGVRLVWIVFPGNRTVEVWREATPAHILGIEDELDGEDVLSGFSLSVRELFR